MVIVVVGNVISGTVWVVSGVVCPKVDAPLKDTAAAENIHARTMLKRTVSSQLNIALKLTAYIARPQKTLLRYSGANKRKRVILLQGLFHYSTNPYDLTICQNHLFDTILRNGHIAQLGWETRNFAFEIPPLNWSFDLIGTDALQKSRSRLQEGYKILM